MIWTHRKLLRSTLSGKSMMPTRNVIYKTDDATVWHVVESEGIEHWETEIGIQKILVFDTEAKAMAHARLWEGDARHSRLHQESARRRR